MTQEKQWITKTILLHKDEQMRKAKSSEVSQPHQLDLFQMLVNENYSNSVELYQSLPDLFSWKQDKFRNKDGTLPVLSRHWMYNKTAYCLDISPANITIIDSSTKEKQKKAFYKTIIADFVEHALHKLSIADGFFLNNNSVNTDEFGLITTFYQVREELKRMWKNYNYAQIKEGISILAGLRYEMTWDISKEYGIDSFFSPIDLTIKNDRKNPHHSELYITFNKLVSKKILSLDWRGFNYSEFMKVKTSFWRTLFLRLSHKFKQADAIKGYHFLLSTLIKEWALQDDLITTNIRTIQTALKDCHYIIDHYDVSEQYDINPKTNRRMMTDYKVVIYPTKNFQDEQYRLNSHYKNIQEHKITKDDEVVIKPMRDQYDRTTFKDFLNDQAKFDVANSQKTENH